MSPNIPPAVSGFLASLRALLVAAGALMVGFHWEQHEAYKWVTMTAGATLVIGPMLWSVYVAGVQTYKNFAAAVQAGINLAVTGRALDENGKVISQFDAKASGTPPKAVTVATAQQIVSSFGPEAKEVKRS